MSEETRKDKENLAGHKSQQELLLDKIKLLLKDTDPDRWRKGGYPIDSDDRFEKPRQTWEEVYTFEVNKGVLVVRASTPVKSDFQGRGFKLIAIGPPIFTIEIRAPGWHHTELTDPYKRSRLADRRCEVLAEGGIAKKLYDYVEEAYNAYHDALRTEFEKQALDFVSALPAKMKEETVNRWERTEEEAGDVHYIGRFDNLTVDVSRCYVNEREQYGLLVKRDRLKAEIRDRGLAKEIFHGVEELGQTSRLLTLTKALELD